MRELTQSEIQQGSLQVLLKIKEICEKEKLRFCLTYDTLIGAIRHHGFIPWDDDIDIWMPREDYEKFVDYCIANADSLKPFELKHYRTCKEYIYPIARLSDSRYVSSYKNAKDYGLGLFVDIYPLDGIDIRDKRFIRSIKRRIWWISLCGSDHLIASKCFLKTVCKIPFYWISRCINLNRLLRKQDIAAQKYDFNTSEMFTCVTWEIGKCYKKEDIRSFIWVDFENESMPIPVGYENILKHEYGDYMKLPPEEERFGHHCYRIFEK